MSAGCADTDGVVLRSDTIAAEIDIVTARGEIATGVITQGDISATARVDEQRVKTVGGVVVASRVVCERIVTGGSVVVAGAEIERTSTDGRVAETAGVAIERRNTEGRVGVAVVLKKSAN